MWSRLFAAIVLISSLGCASGDRVERITRPVDSAPFENPDGKAKIVVLSPSVHGKSKLFAFGITHPVKVNGTELGAIQANDYVQCLVEPGDVTVWSRGQHVSELTFPVATNRLYYVVAMPRRGRYYSNVDLQIAPPNDGMRLVGAGTDKTNTR